MNNSNNLIVTSLDKKRLADLFQSKSLAPAIYENLKLLEEKLQAAKTVTSKKVPPTVVTMNSKVEVKNLSLGRALSIELVYPQDVDPSHAKISIFSPLGAAMFGHAQGDEFQWVNRGAKSRFVIEKIVYQPESAGDYHL